MVALLALQSALEGYVRWGEPVRVREEVLNVLLAELLERRGLVSVPETITRSITSSSRRLPDVMVADLFGVRMVIEGRVAGPNVHTSLAKDASGRVEEGISPICLAVIYPAALRSAKSLEDLRERLDSAVFEVRVFSESTSGDWAKGSVNEIAEILRNSYELLVREDVVVAAVEELTSAIDFAADRFAASPSAGPRLRMLLGIPEEIDETISSDESDD